MEKLADISTFESLMDDSAIYADIAVEQKVGQAQKYKGNQTITKELFGVDDPESDNRNAARSVGKEVAKEFRDSGFDDSACVYIVKAYDTVARLCDSLGIDCTDKIKQLKAKPDEYAIPYKAFYTFQDKKILVSPELANPDQVTTDGYSVYTALVHELTHGILDSPLGDTLEKRLPVPRDWPLTKQDLGEGKFHKEKRDVIRWLLTRDPYASTIYKTNIPEMKHEASEYLPTLLSRYLRGQKIPRLWAWNVVRKLKKETT